ncbi:MAG: cohesin domain-containing protein [Clostridiales bacterium]|nr:cohesin domain-containing protein [Clostridiales bacterium]
MSKIKRIISVTLSILLILSSVPILASAATPVLSATATEAGVGEEITITVSVSGFTGAEDGAIFFTFDPEVLEFVSITGAEIEYLSTVAGMVRDNETQLSYAYWFAQNKSANIDSTELVYLTFNVLKAGDASVTWTCVEWDGVDTPAGGTITITVTDEPTTEEPTTQEPTTEGETIISATATDAYVGEEVTITVSVSGYV